MTDKYLMNRLGNVRNYNQTDAKRVLVVCSAGVLRSPTAANVLHKELGYNTRAAGAFEEFALIVVDKVLWEWADEVICVSKEVANHLFNRGFTGHNRLIVLDIPDTYKWGDPDLAKLLMKQYRDVGIMEKAVT